MANGWTGNILRVNLTTGNITLEDSSKFKSFVGGMGFGYKIMYDEVPPGTKPFDEANKLVFATGPLTGSISLSMAHKTGLALLLLISVNTTPMMLAVFSIITALLCVPDITAQCH